MTDYCEHCSQPLEFHGTICMRPREDDNKRITELEERVSQLERDRKAPEDEMIIKWAGAT